MNKQANPQGKGLVPVLESLAQSRALVPALPKHIEQISRELFTSLFILHSQFQFKPIVGQSYWLYRRNSIFRLSLISPKEWGVDHAASFGQYIGECVLQKDITWTLKLDEQAANDAELMQYIENKGKEFEQALQSADSLDEAMPFYLDALPFYQRVFASALANSLQASLQKSGIQGLNYEQAQKQLSCGDLDR